MPILLPNLDDRNFEGILEEALRRIPIYTPEWDNFNIESDPGLTLVQLFASITESLLYRANRVPELNRLKFLQLLNVSLQPASPAEGMVVVNNERGPVAPLLLEQGVPVLAGNVPFVTRDPLNVLPVQAQAYYKRPIPPTDPAYASYREKYEAVLAARLAEQADAEGLSFPTSSAFEALGTTPQFYEPARFPLPRKGEPLPAFDLTTGIDRAVWLALLAPAPEVVEQARQALANSALSIGIAPAVSGGPPPLRPLQAGTGSAPSQGLVFEIPDVTPGEQPPTARYARLPVVFAMDISRMPGVIMVQLPEAPRLQTWSFDEPLDEGTSDFPPRLEDEDTQQRLVTWLRIRLPDPPAAAGPDQASPAASPAATVLSWVGVNAARVVQSVPVFNEFVGLGTNEPDQVFTLANVPVLPYTLRLVVEEPDAAGAPTWQVWQQVDDLLSAGPDERVFTLDAESGLVRGGDGLRAMRFRGRILASYEYGGGPQGNLPIGAIDASSDPRLGGGYTLANPLPTSGGALGETPLDGERRIPLVVRHRDRLVTMQDFRDVTRRTPGVNVGRVEVLPLFRPDQPTASVPGAVTVMVIPRFPTNLGSGAADPLWPVPDRLFLSRVCSHLDERRLVTTEVYVNGPVYRRVFVSVGIQVLAGFFVDKVEKDAEVRLGQYLSVLPPGGPEGAGWPLNKRLVKKDLEAVVTRVPGVEYVDSIEMGVESPQDVDFADLAGLELPRLAGVSVRQGPAESLALVYAPPGSAPSLTQDVPIPVTRAKC